MSSKVMNESADPKVEEYETKACWQLGFALKAPNDMVVVPVPMNTVLGEIVVVF